jgi:hypothetical protein
MMKAAIAATMVRRINVFLVFIKLAAPVAAVPASDALALQRES